MIGVLAFIVSLSLCSARNERQGEHVAPFSGVVEPRDWLPDGHPVQTMEGNPDLPDGCITYKDRYKRASENRHQVYDVNEVTPQARVVLLIRLHAKVQWKDDLLLFLRSIMFELSEAGIHLYFLVEESLSSQNSPDANPERLRHSVPPAFRPLAFFFNQNDIHNQYPRLHKFELFAREYLPVTWFIHRYPAYRFIWYMEYDVRYTGPDFGAFLNTALLVATETLQRDDPDHEGELDFQLATAGDWKHSAHGPDHNSTAQLPDLLMFGDGTHSHTIGPDMQPRDQDHWNFTHMHHRQVQLFGMSRKYSEMIHSYAVEGIGGYIEEFVPSMAKETNLSVVSVPVSMFDESFHCCTNASDIYYTDWYTSGQCRQYAVLHPVKLKGELWAAGATNDKEH